VVTEADLTEAQLDAGVLPGTISVRNTGLRPWTADNYDLRLEHYSKAGGLVTAGIFLKEIDDFFGNDTRIATAADLEELGLDSQYLDWEITTQFNSGNARVRGVEFNLRQPLTFFGPWGRRFIVFANATKLKIDGPSNANFSGFVPESANWGFSFKAKRVGFEARWIYRGDVPGAAVAALGPDAIQYTVASTRIDLGFSYEFRRYLRLAVGLTNVNEVPIEVVRYGSQTPEYARPGTYRDLGIPITISLKGTF
jgi:iron complex outermembrane receptor protein